MTPLPLSNSVLDSSWSGGDFRGNGIVGRNKLARLCVTVWIFWHVPCDFSTLLTAINSDCFSFLWQRCEAVELAMNKAVSRKWKLAGLLKVCFCVIFHKNKNVPCGSKWISRETSAPQDLPDLSAGLVFPTIYLSSSCCWSHFRFLHLSVWGPQLWNRHSSSELEAALMDVPLADKCSTFLYIIKLRS